ncbi:MAG: rod shape-determining protein MreD [Candidatus Omnitrophota bacterium]|jgi:rod shape-determining protein MreD
MRKLILITIFTFLFYLIEFILFNTVGHLFKPNLLLLLVIFTNFAFGIRYSIFTAVLAGVVKDSFSTGVFGINFFSFILCAYFVTFLMQVFHMRSSVYMRLLMIFYVVIFNTVLQYFLHKIFIPTQLTYVIMHIFIPQVVSTLIIANFTIESLKKCVSRLFVY